MYPSGESALLVTEQLAFQKTERDSGARTPGPLPCGERDIV